MKGPLLRSQGIDSNVETGDFRCCGCDRVIGTVWFEHCTYLYLSVRCRCGCHGYLEYESGGDGGQERSGRIYYKSGRAVCQYCSSPLFQLGESELVNFSFRTSCRCGNGYDNRFE